MIRCSAFSGARRLFVGSPSRSIFLFEHDLSKAGIHFSGMSGCRFPHLDERPPGTPVPSVQAKRYATGTPLDALKLKPSLAAWPESVRQWHGELLRDGHLFALNTRPLKATPRQGSYGGGHCACQSRSHHWAARARIPTVLQHPLTAPYIPSVTQLNVFSHHR
jgi:hypothetical protein